MTEPLSRSLLIFSATAALLASCEKAADAPLSAETAAPPAAVRPAVPEPEPDPGPAAPTGYSFRDGQVWHLSAARYYDGARMQPTLVPGADPATFQALPPPEKQVPMFGKDRSAAYFQHRKIEGADVATFSPVGMGLAWLARDATRIFFKDTVLCEGADAFTLVGREFAHNGQAVYHTESGTLATEDVAGFRLIHSADGSEWHADGRNVWCDGVEITGADPKTFRVLSKHYAMDANRVYFWTEVIPDADLATFEVTGQDRASSPLEPPTARDAKRTYEGSTPSPRED